jgi:hypothetical protein
MPRRQDNPSYRRRYPIINLFSRGQLMDWTSGFRRCDDALRFFQATCPWEQFDEAVFEDTGMGDPPRLRNNPNYKQREALQTVVKELTDAS